MAQLFSLGITTRMAPKHLSPEASLAIGIVLAAVAVIYLALILFRYEWLRRFRVMRSIWRWGYWWDWSYPASRLGAFTGGLVLLFMGLMPIDDYFKILPRGLMPLLFILLLPFVAFVAIHDYNLHKKHDEILHKRRDA